uniref:Uncharacterized protein n=3 Tax=Dunaliella tertiolecta TaxID=3047 RepID=A0A7S3QND8_DUNTE
MEESGFVELGQATRNLLQTYPPTYPPPPPGVVPVEEVPDTAPPLSEEEGISPSPITISSSLRVPGNSTERASIMENILADIRGNSDPGEGGSRDEATLRKRKQTGRRLFSGRATAEELLDNALFGAEDARSGQIRMFIVRDGDGNVAEDQDLDFEITLFVPDNLSDEARAQNAQGSQERLNSNDTKNRVRSQFQDALRDAVNNAGLSDSISDDDITTAANELYESVAADDGSSGAVVKAGLLGLFVSAAVVLLLA